MNVKNSLSTPEQPQDRQEAGAVWAHEARPQQLARSQSTSRIKTSLFPAWMPLPCSTGTPAQITMATPKPDTLEFLLQADVIRGILTTINNGEWQTLYRRADQAPHRLGMWCALLDAGAAEKAMTRDDWDLMIGAWRPGFSRKRSAGKEVTTYHRFAGQDGVWPLILYRSFHDAYPDYFEVAEEFRLYHQLAEDKDRGILLSFDASGREVEVVRITRDEVCARRKYLRQFQAGTGMHLAIYIDSARYSKIPLKNVPTRKRERISVDELVRWRLNVGKCQFRSEFATVSRLLAKIILEPPPKEKSGIWPFKENDDAREVTFIIGVDQDGNEVEYTSDPGKLGNYFGANPSAPHYLTPVHFRREVLVKYFAEPERYRVSDGLLSCLGLWSCQIDNDLASRVVVFLGDLGRDLPYEERLHWRQFNVVPEGGVSATNVRRSFLAQFADATSPDLVFRREYAAILRAWERCLGWPLFLAPAAGDAYLLDTVRIPLTDSQAEIDEQIGRLAKLLVDSLNERELAARAGAVSEGSKGIGKLAAFLEITEFPERDALVVSLRNLQSLRSAGTAHRKGSGYDRIVSRLGVDLARRPEVLKKLLGEAASSLRALRLHYCGNRECS